MKMAISTYLSMSTTPMSQTLPPNPNLGVAHLSAALSPFQHTL
jgi:hypothetical protein